MAANDEPCCKPMFWIYLIICVALVLFAGLMSGLTLGLMSLSQIDLEVLSKSGQPKDRKNAAKILPVVKNQHLLLCTLLVGNSLAMEALPIFLDSLLPAWGAIIISVTLILAFGEIIPQAICSRYGLSVGAKMVVLVRLLLLVFLPITYPISKLLDWVLGKGHSALLRRAELKTLVDMHGDAAGKGGELTHDETTIITGALDLTQKTAYDAMTPIQKIFSLDIDLKLDMYTMGLVISKGHSRVPIYSGSPTNIIGLILVKNLIKCRPEDETPIRNATIRRIPRVPDYMPLYEILNEFQEGHSHMAVVVKGMKDDKKAPKTTKGRPSMLSKKTNTNWIHSDKEKKVGSDPSLVLEVVTEASSVHSGVIRTPDPNLKNDLVKRKDMHLLIKEWDRRSENVLDANLESLPSYSAEEQVIGIITMEDVIEELLQEEIYDETDEYIDVHNKIKINMLPPRRSSPRSPQMTMLSNLLQRTPVASPHSSHHQTPMLNSPMSPYVQPPAPRPSLSNSPGNQLQSSPTDFVGPGRTSLASNQVSRKPYEKLHKLQGV